MSQPDRIGMLAQLQLRIAAIYALQNEDLQRQKRQEAQDRRHQEIKESRRRTEAQNEESMRRIASQNEERTNRQRNSPPSVNGRPLKIYYATQAGIKPVRVKLFVNNTLRATSGYKRYLDRKIRDAFGLEGSPIDLKFVPRPRPDLEEKMKKRKS